MRIQDNIANEFNMFSRNYTSDMTQCVPHYLKLLAAFTYELPKNFIPLSILDLGCGNGNVTAVLLSQFPEARYTLLDASEEMLKLCDARFQNPNFTYVASYFQDFDFQPNQYDLVAAGFSIHHCGAEEKQALFEKIYDSLKPGGIIAMSDLMIDRSAPEHASLLKEWNQFVQKSYPDGEKWEWLMEHYNAFDHPHALKEHISWMEQAGFQYKQPFVYDDWWVHIRARKDKSTF